MPKDKDTIPPGTLYMLILKTLARSGRHAWLGHRRGDPATVSADVLQVEEGSLYPALQRMLVKGWVTPNGACRRITAARASTRSRPKAVGSSSRSCPSMIA